MWYTGPLEKQYTARKGGKLYSVTPAFAKMFARSGPIVWWSSDGLGNNKLWKTKEAAMKWCERDAGIIPTTDAAMRASERGGEG